MLCIAFVTSSTPAVGEKELNLNITSPREGEVYRVGDAIPRYIPISVLGVIDARYGIQNITISNGIRETTCGFTPGNHSEILCDMKLDLSVSQISITALDKQGNTVRIVRNYSLEINQLAPSKTTNILTPENPSVSGFGFPVGICSLLIGLLLLTVRNNNG